MSKKTKIGLTAGIVAVIGLATALFVAAKKLDDELDFTNLY